MYIQLFWAVGVVWTCLGCNQMTFPVTRNTTWSRIIEFTVRRRCTLPLARPAISSWRIMSTGHERAVEIKRIMGWTLTNVRVQVCSCIRAYYQSCSVAVKQHHTHIGKKRKTLNLFSHGYLVMASGIFVRGQHGNHTPANSLSKTYSCSVQHTSLILHIHVMVNWHLWKQGVCWPVSYDHIVGSDLELIKITCFLKVGGCRSAGFQADHRLKVNLLRS